MDANKMETPVGPTNQVQTPAAPSNSKRSRKLYIETLNDLETPIPSSSQRKTRRALFNGEEDNMQSWKNLCTVCLVDMGEENPRQLCGKTRCLNDGIDSTDINYEIPPAAAARLESELPLPSSIQPSAKRRYSEIISEPSNLSENECKMQKVFITQNDFDEAVQRDIPIAWIELDSTKIYKVHSMEIRHFVKDGEEKSGGD